jgi:hypothetical protein
MRIRTILAAAAAPAALAAIVLGTAGQASASTVPGSNPGNSHSVIAVDTQAKANDIMNAGGTDKGIDVPQGADVQLRWTDIKGNVSVEGHLSLASSIVEGNVNVSGPSAALTLFNDPGNHILGNLVVNNAGGYYLGRIFPLEGLQVASNGQQVDGGLTFTNNTRSMLDLSGSLHVNGKFVYSGNALVGGQPFVNNGNLTVDGQQFVS